MRYYNIPIFIPHLACPFRCVFCDQTIISAREESPAPESVSELIEEYLSTIPAGLREVEIAFFGGSFTALPLATQNEYLQVAQKFVQAGLVQGIRLSTRPDCIDEVILENLKRRQVVTIELGIQSFSNRVLIASRRGYTAKCAEEACKLIKAYGFKLGIQLMTGLPEDNEQCALESVEKAVQLNPDMVRIYPAVVLKNTELAFMLQTGKYQPQSLEEAINICKKMLLLFENNNIKVIRMGLQNESNLNRDEFVLGGAFHPSFRELVEQSVFFDQAASLINNFKLNEKFLNIYVYPRDVSKLIGANKQNIDNLQKKFGIKLKVIQDDSLTKNTLGISLSDRTEPEILLNRKNFLFQKFAEGEGV